MTTDVEDRANTRASCHLGGNSQGKAAWASGRDEVRHALARAGTVGAESPNMQQIVAHGVPAGGVSRMAKAPVLVLGVYVQWDR